jgi:proline dehydrogenase
MNHSLRHHIGQIVFPLMSRAARSYIAGPELRDALTMARALNAQGRGSTIAFWDEEGAAAADVLNACLESAAALGGETLDCYLSVKAWSVQYSAEAFLRVIDHCKTNNTRLHFDSHELDSAAPTRALVEGLLPRYSNLSFTLPGRWARSVEDAEWAMDRGVAVRVVKGQWADPAMPERDPHQGFLEVIGQLAGGASLVSVATHNPELAAPALERLVKAGTRCELELLFGLPSKAVMKVAAEMGVRTRVYVPYGYGWLPYSLAQARKNPRILWWMLKDAMLPRSDVAILAGR